MRLLASLTATGLLVAGAALAQPTAGIPQVSDPSQSVGVEPPAPANSAQAPAQISSDSESGAAETQLTSARASKQQPTQLSTGPRSAQAPTNLSRPAEGRTAVVERVAGTDRCDPAVAKEKQTDACKQVIETRADDYARPQPPELSPEQRLLLDQQFQGAGEVISDATHRLATTGQSDSSTESMGIASIVLQQSEAQKQPDKQNDPTADAAVQAIIQLMNQTPQN